MNKYYKLFKKNKYKLFLLGLFAIVLVFVTVFIKKKYEDMTMSKYNNNIVIIKGNGDELKSFSIKELKSLGSNKTEVYINNGLEKVEIEGISLEKLIGNLDYNFRDRPTIEIEDTNGSATRYPMSVALEVDRIYLVYKIEGQPLLEFNPSYGTLAIIDTNSKSASSWITNVKTLNLQ